MNGRLVDVGDDLVACGADLVLGDLLLGEPELAHDRHAVLGGLADERLVVSRQLFPGLLRHHQHFRDDQVLVEGVVLGDLVVARGVVGRPVVLGAVDDAGLDGRIDLAIGHRHGIGAERLHHRHEDVGLHDAELQAGEVGHRVDRTLGIVEGARAAVIEGQADEVVRREGVEDLLADRAVHDVMHVLDRAEDVGQRRDLGLGDDVVERPEADAVHVDDAELRLLDGVLLFAELRAEVDVEAQAAAGLVLDDLADVLDGLDGRIAVRMGIGRPQGDIARHAGAGQGNADSQRAESSFNQAHVSFLRSWLSQSL